MNILNFLPVCVLLTLTVQVLGSINRTSAKEMLVYKRIHVKKNNPEVIIDIRTTDNPDDNSLNDPYLQKILQKYHATRRARKLERHKQMIKESVECAAKQKVLLMNVQRLPAQQQQELHEQPARTRSKGERRHRKHKSTVYQPGKGKALAPPTKHIRVTWKPNVASNVLDLSRYKVKGLRVDKTDFDGRDYYSPYLDKKILTGNFLPNLLY